MRKSFIGAIVVAVAVAVGLAVYWRWFPRAGTKWANEVGNPWLVKQGWAGTGQSELGTLEHFGRKSGTRHLTPVHPVATADGFRIVVPLAEESQWAMNVLAAGHCRLHLHDTIYELDEPVLVNPVDVRELSAPMRWAAARLGFKYLRLHRFAEEPGSLEPIEGDMAEVPAIAEVAEATAEVAEAG